ncbi:MAG: DUF885 domain-containing protein [Gammaproteobacteria bacterium]|nr:DUF885 domain-containing protein [Gammaproteobacteria bacterium]MYF68086.1 DUF885 domain-containing protein [Gammaproteobacteria bacterium]MYK37631.1 DUF885 domain-containing protein [Gammaproteobacteria bacterium]
MNLRETSIGLIAALAAAAGAISGCGGEAPEEEPMAMAESGWGRFTGEFIEDLFAAEPTRAVWAGRHEFDGQLPDVSAQAIRERGDMLRQYVRRAQGEFPAEALDPEQDLERRHLLASIESMLFSVEVAEYHRRNPAWYAGRLSPSVYVSRDYASRDERLAALTAHLQKVPAYLEQMRGTLEPPFARPFVRTALVNFGGLASHFEDDVPGLFADVADEDLQAAFAEALAPAVQALREVETWLELRLEDASGDFALGEERYRELLWRRYRIDLDWKTLKGVAQADLARNLELLRTACKQVDPEITIAECAAMVRDDKPAQGAVARANEQLPELRDFLLHADIVGIPSDETAFVAEAPAYRRTNSAYIEIPGAFEEGLPAIYYIAGPDPEWPPEVQRQYVPGEADLLNTSVHEVWPGHFLHSLYIKRSGNRMGKIIWNAMLSEGWAHYTEELMQEAGLGEGKPLLRVGQILDALMRDVRFLSSIGLHVEGMDVETSQRMFAELAYLDPGNAQQQALRGTYDPDYFVYTLGKLIIVKMREDWTADRGGRTAWKDFHEQLLSLGNAPLPALREAMMGPDDPGPLL